MDSIVLICEDSIEGIFTAVYESYCMKLEHENSRIQIGEEGNLRLFSTCHTIIPDQEKAVRVIKTLITRFGQEVYYTLCQALSTEDADKGDAVYHTIVHALARRKRFYFMDHLAVPCVMRVFELARYAQNEIQHLKGFLRFQELENGLLFARIGPNNNIVTFLAPHFSDRYPNENFVIYDENRRIFVLHPVRKQWSVVTGESIDEEMTKQFSKKEKEYQELFRYFCDRIAIKERKNPGLQRQMLPIRFQEYMVEFDKK